MDWKWEKTPDGKIKLVKYEEDHISDIAQLGAMLRHIIAEEQRLLQKLGTIREKKKALISILQQLDADIDALIQPPKQQNPPAEKV